MFTSVLRRVCDASHWKYDRALPPAVFRFLEASSGRFDHRPNGRHPLPFLLQAAFAPPPPAKPHRGGHSHAMRRRRRDVTWGAFLAARVFHIAGGVRMCGHACRNEWKGLLVRHVKPNITKKNKRGPHLPVDAGYERFIRDEAAMVILYDMQRTKTSCKVSRCKVQFSHLPLVEWKGLSSLPLCLWGWVSM